MTDNRNRTAGDLRHLFDKFGEILGKMAVYYLCSIKGVIVIERTEDIDEDELMMEAIEEERRISAEKKNISRY